MTDRQIEDIMEEVCELCHYPYVCYDQDELDRTCARCVIEPMLREVDKDL